MRGLIWAGTVWSIALFVVALMAKQRGLVFRLEREHLAALSLLLGTHAIAGSSTADEILANPIVLERVVRGGLTALAGVIILPNLVRSLRTGAMRLTMPGVTALLFYGVVACVSVAYSVARVVTFGKAAELAMAIAIIVAVAFGPDPARRARSLLEFVLFMEGVLLLVAVVGFFGIPSVFAVTLPRPGFVFPATMAAPFAHPNVLSALGGLVAAYALARSFETPTSSGRMWWRAGFIVATIGVVLSAGRQGVAMWLVGVAVLLFVHRRSLFLVLLGPAAVAVVVSTWDVLWPILNRQAPYHFATLTGRVGWWAAALDAWALHPWTGYGFGAGGRFVALTSLGAGARSNVHSGYIEGLVGVGLLGMIPLVYALVRSAVWSAKTLRYRHETYFAILLVPLMLHTGIDLGFGAWVKPDFLLLGCLVAISDIARRSRRIDDVSDPESKLVPARFP